MLRSSGFRPHGTDVRHMSQHSLASHALPLPGFGEAPQHQTLYFGDCLDWMQRWGKRDGGPAPTRGPEAALRATRHRHSAAPGLPHLVAKVRKKGTRPAVRKH